jgi:hypothetical protein
MFLYAISIIVSLILSFLLLIIYIAVPIKSSSTSILAPFKSYLQARFPYRYEISTHNPIFQVQFVQLLSATIMAYLGTGLGKFSSDHPQRRCNAFVVVFMMFFGFNLFCGYCFMLIKGLAVDHNRYSEFKEYLRMYTALLCLLTFIVPRSFRGEVDAISGECNFSVRPSVGIALAVLGSVMDITAKLLFAKLFSRPLNILAAAQERAGNEGMSRAARSKQLIKENTRINVISGCVNACGFLLLLLFQRLELRDAFVVISYLCIAATTMPSFLGTKSAWRKTSYVNPFQVSGPSGSADDSKATPKASAEDPVNTQVGRRVNMKAPLESKEDIDMGKMEEMSRSNNLRSLQEPHNETRTFGRGGYTTAGSGMAASGSKVEVDLKFKTKDVESALNVQGLEQTIQEDEEVLHDAHVPVGRGQVNQHRDMYLDPVTPMFGGISRGAARAHGRVSMAESPPKPSIAVMLM